MGNIVLNNTVVVGIYSNEIRMLAVIDGEPIMKVKPSNSTQEWESVIRDLFLSSKLGSNVQVRVVLGNGFYTQVSLPKNDSLTEEELYSVAMYKDLEPNITGQISDYTWDYYEAKTGKNSPAKLNFILVEKKIIAQISNIINEIAKLESITVFDLAVSSFISGYQILSIPNRTLNDGYLPQLCIMLYMPKNAEMTLFGVHNGELCYSRVLKGYKALSLPTDVGNDLLLNRLITEILRLSDDFFTSQLGLPQFTKLLLALDVELLPNIANELSSSFIRRMEVIPTKKLDAPVPSSYTVCKNDVVNKIAQTDISYLPLFGVLNEGDGLKNEKN